MSLFSKVFKYIWPQIKKTQAVFYFIIFFVIKKLSIGTKRIPIKIPNANHEAELIKLADEMLKLNKELQIVENGSNRWNQLKSEIDRVDKQIDQMVYKLYDLAPEEIKIVENENKVN